MNRFLSLRERFEKFLDAVLADPNSAVDDLNQEMTLIEDLDFLLLLGLKEDMKVLPARVLLF